jgi:uncharacterized protein (TIGR02266 family)
MRQNNKDLANRPGVERRRFPRYDVSISVRFSSDMLDFDSTVSDISLGGLFVRSELLDVPGTPVQLSLQMPGGGDRVHVSGQVAWIVERPPKGPGMGIRLRDGLAGERIFEELFVPSR